MSKFISFLFSRQILAFAALLVLGATIWFLGPLLAFGGFPRDALHGTRGSWAKFKPDVQEDQLKGGMLPTDPEFGYDPDPGIHYDGETGTQTKIPAPASKQVEYYAGIRDAIFGRGPVPVELKYAIAGMAILETSFESGARGQVLPIPLTAEERAQWT